MRPQQLTLPSRQSLLHGTTENHKLERVQIITIYNCSTRLGSGLPLQFQQHWAHNHVVDGVDGDTRHHSNTVKDGAAIDGYAVHVVYADLRCEACAEALSQESKCA